MVLLASSVSSSPLSDFQVLFAQFTRQTHCLLFARADVCLIQHLLLLSPAGGKSHCSLFSLLFTTPLPRQPRCRKEGQWRSSWQVIPCSSIFRSFSTISCILKMAHDKTQRAPHWVVSPCKELISSHWIFNVENKPSSFWKTMKSQLELTHVLIQLISAGTTLLWRNVTAGENVCLVVWTVVQSQAAEILHKTCASLHCWFEGLRGHITH